MGEGTVVTTIAGMTDVGMVRTNNEDSFVMADLAAKQSFTTSSELSYKLGDSSLLLVVSDGVGGGEAGEVASEHTVISIRNALMGLSRELSAHDRLVAAVEEANHVVWTESSENEEWKGMAATVTAALIEGGTAFIAEVGDSRAYLVRSGFIKQVTTDQSFVAQLVSRGLLKPEDAVEHPRKNVILQAVGAREIVKVAVSMFQIQQGDILLLCSDGLSNQVNTGELLFFAENKEPEEACKQLIDLAKQRGGPDNITVIMAKFGGEGLTLNNQEPAKLTGLLQNLSTYDPDQELEKSHKRTQLLGNSSLSGRLYGQQVGASPMQTVTNLTTCPNSPALKEECERLIEWLNYSHQLLSVKSSQVIQAAQWLENRGHFYVNYSEVLQQIKTGLEHIEKANEVAAVLLKEFLDTDGAEGQ
jgi:PPM family protein phosphatase